MEESNYFDQLGFQDPEEVKKQIEQSKAEGEKVDHLIHRVFQQSEAGQELMEMWERSLLLVPTARPGDDLLQIGINEGTKQFIRNIKLTIEKVENDG